MSLALALKYRPTKFEQLTEQSNIKIILKSQLENDAIKNAYLFTGPAGCGKTTSARIFANTLNGTNKTYIELDGASNNSVDDIRKIIEEAKFKDLTSEYKIYIIDECHQLSSGAWAALLKLLEEPPAKTVFILCTTDAQKIPNTILSRVQRFDFKRISFTGICKRLDYILSTESITTQDIEWDKEAVEYIARISDGGMRDSITLLDKCLAYSHNLTVDNVTKALDFVNMDIMYDLTRSLFERDISNLISLTENLYREGTDIKLFCKQYLSFILNVIKLLATKDPSMTNLTASIISMFENGKDNFNLEVVTDINFYKVLLNWLLKLNEIIKWETSPKNLFQANLISFITGA